MARNLTLEAASASRDLYLGAVPADPLAAGTASLTSKTATTVNLSATAASGGDGSYAYQWQRSASGAGTWADVSGATALTLADTGLTASTAYDYRLRVTDGEDEVDYSNTVTVTTDAAPVSLPGLTIATDAILGSPQTSPVLRYGGKVFLGASRDNGSFYAFEVDEATGTVTGSSLIGTLSADRHMNAPMAVLPDGKIVAVYDDHGSGRLRVTSAAGTVLSGWDTERTIPGDVLYTQPIVTEEGAGTERIYVHYTRYVGGSARVACYVYTDDRGVTWSSEVVKFTNAGDWVYDATRRSTETGRVLTVLADDNSSQGEADGYLMIYDPSLAAWTAADGTALTLPVDAVSAQGDTCRFYDASANGGRYMEFAGLAHEHAGRICIPFQAKAAGAGADRYVRALIEAGVVTLQTVYEASGDVLRNGVVMQTGDDSVIWGLVEVAGETDVYTFTTDDDGATWASENVTNGALPAVTDPALDTWTLFEVRGGTTNNAPWALHRYDWPAADDFDGNIYLYLGAGTPTPTGLHVWLSGVRYTATPVPA